MKRRHFLKTAAFAAAGTALGASLVDALSRPLPKMKITRVRFYESPLTRPMFNQSFHIVTVETDAGITGIGEGGSRDTVRECAEMLIGATSIESRIRNLMNRILKNRKSESRSQESE